MEIKRKKARDIRQYVGHRKGGKAHKRRQSAGRSSNEHTNMSQDTHSVVAIFFNYRIDIWLSGQLDIFKSMIIEEVMLASLQDMLVVPHDNLSVERRLNMDM